MKSQVLLVGSGGVGTIASLNLELSGKASVTSVLRSDYKQVVENGFQIESCDHGNFDHWRPSSVVSSVQEASKQAQYDYIIVSTKVLPDILPTERLIAPAVTKGKTAIVLLQNGVGIEDPVAAAFPGSVILSGVSMIGSHNFGGKIVQEEPDLVEFGYFDSPTVPQARAEATAMEFVDMYRIRNPNAKYTDNLQYTRWKKLVYNSAINTVCALTGIDTARAYLSGLDKSVILPAMKEVRAIAASAGFEIPEAVDQAMLTADDGVYFKPSMQVDTDKGNPIELEAILGNPLRVARANGVPAPTLQLVYNLLKAVQFRLLEGRGHVDVPATAPRRDQAKPIWAYPYY